MHILETTYPHTTTVKEGTLTIYDGRGPNRKGFAAYLKTPGSIIPRVGIGATPALAVHDILSVREVRA